MANNFINRMFNKFGSGVESRTSLENPQTPLSYPAEWLLDIFNGGRTDSGIRVSEMTALQVGTVYACCNVISDGISSLPLHVYKRTTTGATKRAGKLIAVDNNLYDILHNEPNPEMTSAVFLKVLMVHCLLWGNGYAELERDGGGSIIGLWPRNPARTRPIRLLKQLMFRGDMLPAGTLLFETSDNLMDNSSATVDQNPDEQNIGRRRLIPAEDMLHIPGLSLDGRLGQSTVWLARQAFGLALATEKYGAKFFGNGARPAGVLTLPTAMQTKDIETLRRSWAEAHGGENQFKVAVLEEGIKFTKIAATPEEGQMLETRKYEREEICAIFGVPAHMVAASDKGGKSNVEQSSIEFVLYCLHPWLHRFEQEMTRKLFPKMGRTAGQFFPKFDVRKLMYPDAAARSTFYAAGRQWGFLNANMILELEDMNPIEDDQVGETFWMPINMQDAGDPQKLGAGDQSDLDTKKANDIAEHASQLQQDAAATQTKLQMKAAEQAHGHAMEAGAQSNKHVVTMTKLGHPPIPPGGAAPPAVGEPAADAKGAAPTATPAGTPKGTKAAKRFTALTEVRMEMEAAMNAGFVFITAINEVGETTYRYLHPDKSELLITFVPETAKD